MMIDVGRRKRWPLQVAIETLCVARTSTHQDKSCLRQGR